MTMLFRPPRLTAAEFEQLPDHKGYELVDGRLREKGVGIESSEIQSELNYLLRQWVRRTRAGVVYDSECAYRCFPDNPDRTRKPDVSFVLADRLPGDRASLGSFPIRPDLVVEVVSLNETVFDLNEKLTDYRAVGVPLIWVVHPDIRTVQVRAAGGPVRELAEADTLTGDPVLPGFSVRVADLFPPAPAQA